LKSFDIAGERGHLSTKRHSPATPTLAIHRREICSRGFDYITARRARQYFTVTIFYFIEVISHAIEIDTDAYSPIPFLRAFSVMPL